MLCPIGYKPVKIKDWGILLTKTRNAISLFFQIHNTSEQKLAINPTLQWPRDTTIAKATTPKDKNDELGCIEESIFRIFRLFWS